MDISERPDEAGRKERIGDREADTVIGRGHSGAVVSLVDRASGFTFSFSGLSGRTAAAVSAAMLEMLAAVRRARPHDHGGQRQGVRGPRRRRGGARGRLPLRHPLPLLGERGLNGHTNGLVRQYLPKGTDLRAVTDTEVRAGAGPRVRASAPGAGLPDARRGAAQGPPSLTPRDRLPPARMAAQEGGGMDFEDRVRPGSGRAAPGRTRPAPAEALRRP